MIGKITKGAKNFLSKTTNLKVSVQPYARKIDNAQLMLPGFKPNKISYDFSLTIPEGYVRELPKRLGRHIYRNRVAYGTIAGGGGASYVASRMALPKQRRRRRR